MASYTCVALDTGERDSMGREFIIAYPQLVLVSTTSQAQVSVRVIAPATNEDFKMSVTRGKYVVPIIFDFYHLKLLKHMFSLPIFYQFRFSDISALFILTSS